MSNSCDTIWTILENDKYKMTLLASVKILPVWTQRDDDNACSEHVTRLPALNLFILAVTETPEGEFKSASLTLKNLTFLWFRRVNA